MIGIDPHDTFLLAYDVSERAFLRHETRETHQQILAGPLLCQHL